MKSQGADTGVEPQYAHSRDIEALNLDLRESEERYRTLFDLVPVAVYTIDREGVIQHFNRRAAELWGREPASRDTETTELLRRSKSLLRSVGRKSEVT